MIDYTTNYNIFLGREWIHANWCVSSSLHQFLLFWKGNEVEVVRANKQPSRLLSALWKQGIMIRNSIRSSLLAEGKMGSQGKHTLVIYRISECTGRIITTESRLFK